MLCIFVDGHTDHEREAQHGCDEECDDREAEDSRNDEVANDHGEEPNDREANKPDDSS